MGQAFAFITWFLFKYWQRKAELASVTFWGGCTCWMTWSRWSKNATEQHFSQEHNIKAAWTGNIFNLPRLLPQWGTHSTMRGKWAKCRTYSRSNKRVQNSFIQSNTNCVSVINLWMRQLFMLTFSLKHPIPVPWDYRPRPALIGRLLHGEKEVYILLFVYLSCIWSWHCSQHHSQEIESRTQPSLMAFLPWKEAIIKAKWADAERKAFFLIINVV